MDEFWSVHRCRWLPCRGRHDALATPWSLRDDEPEPAAELVLPPLPVQRQPQRTGVDA